MNLSVLDGMIKVSKLDCQEMVRRIMRSDSISLGISSAANLVAVSRLTKTLPSGALVLTMIYDGAESYLSYFG